MSWVITSYLAANAVVIPASGWLTAVFGRRRFYLICTVTFTASSFLSGIAPNLEFLVLMRILQGLGGGAVIPMAQAVMWEIFPLEERGTAMAVWGTGIMLAPILGPTLGGYIADNWSWRWIFYINLPIASSLSSWLARSSSTRRFTAGPAASTWPASSSWSWVLAASSSSSTSVSGTTGSTPRSS